MKPHKLFLIFSFILLFVVNVFGQAAVDISFVATANIYNFPLSVGLDLTATICIDPQLGESDLISPPPGYTEIRFTLWEYGCEASTYKDYRPPGNPPVFPFTGTIEHILWWETSGAPIDITYNLPTGATMRITDQIGGGFLNIGPFSGQGIATIPGTYTDIFHKAFLLMEYTGIIPVEFTSFTASVLRNGKAVQLNWTTETETNNSGFEIERLQDSKIERLKDWETIGFVPGFGTTTEPKSYSFSDEDVTAGTFKYRLKQIDFDGAFNYSNEIEVEVDFTPKEFVLYQNYPNPFNPSTTIKFEIPDVETTRRVVFTTLKVYDVLGNEVATLVNEEKLPSVYEVEFSVGQDSSPEITSGVYFYQLKVADPEPSSGQGFVQTNKMILLK